MQTAASYYQGLTQHRILSRLVPMVGKGHDCGMNQPDSEKKVLDELSAWVKKYN